MATNPVVHFEVTGPDGPALQKYYSDVFGWTVDANNPMNYGIVAAGEGGIGGGIAGSPDGSGYATFYVGVEDVKAALAKALELGGKELMPVMDVPGGPTIAQFQDPQGNRVGICNMV